MKFSVKTLTTSGIMSSLTAIAELIGALIPGVGIFIGGFSSLFVAVAGTINTAGGVMTFLVSGLLIGILMPARLPVFLLTRGLLGLILGITFRLGPKITVTASGLAFATGTFALAFLLGFPLPGFALEIGCWPLSLMTVIVASLFFSWLWFVFLQRFRKRLARFLAEFD